MKREWRLALRIIAPAFLLLTVAPARAEATPSGWLAQGTPAATPCFVTHGRASGPVVVLVGGIHGNEPAGAAAAEQIRHWPLRRGTLVIVPRANALALEANTRTLRPAGGTDRYDLNRAFPPKPGDSHLAADLARSLWMLVETQHPHWLVDLNEGGDFRAQTNGSVGSSVIPSFSPESRRVAEKVLHAVNLTIAATNLQFMLLSQPIKGSLARAAADELAACSMIVETTSKSQPLALRVRQHRIAVHALLGELGMLEKAVTPDWMTSVPSRRGEIKVAVYDGAGNGGLGVARVLAQVGGETNATITRVCPEDIRAGALKQFDVVMFTGGSGSGQGNALGKAGRAEVRRFVENGGGYIGICAGAYLACHGFSWGLGIVDAKTLSPLWRRGTGMVKLELTEQGRAVLGDQPSQFDCLYFQGPIVGRAEVASVPDYDVLAFFRTEIAKNNTPKDIMVKSPAIFSGRFGKGRVLCFSPHPEQTKGLEAFVPRAAAWAAARKNETAAQQ